VIATYGSALIITAAALLLGRGVCVLAGHEGSAWLAPSVGFAALMVICQLAVSLPGHGVTGVLIVLLATVGATAIARRRHAAWPSARDGVVVLAAVALITSVPFLANDRVGVLGVSLLNDTHWHLFLAQGLLDPAIQHLDGYGFGYPIGPHAIAAVAAKGLGASVDHTLTGMELSIPMLTGLSALGALADISRPRRWLVAILAALPYMSAAWLIQSAFKEPIMSLLMLGLVLTLGVGHRERYARPLAVAIPVVVLIIGVIYDYSYPGLIWPVAILGVFLLLELSLGGWWRSLGTVARSLRSAGQALAVAGLVLTLFILPDVHRLYDFWEGNGGTSVGTVGGVTSSALADLAGPLHVLEASNIWLWGDFRFVPPDALQAGALASFAVIVLVFAIIRAGERRDLAWLAGVGGFLLVYLYVRHGQSPYVVAKAMAVPAPLLVLGSGAALMRELDARRWRSISTWGAALAAVVFFVFALESDYLVLRDAPVDPVNHQNELRSLRAVLHGRPTLVLFYDDYFKYELLNVPVSSPLFPSPIPAAIQPQKPWSYGQAMDFASISAATLNQFDYVITTRTRAQSAPPPNFHLVASSPSYEVWQRSGPTRGFSVPPGASGHPGAVVDCRTSAGRAIAHQHGMALVSPAPTYVPLSPLVPGQTATVSLHLPAGEWEISIPFTSPQAVTVTGGGLRAHLPPNLDRPGSIWPVGVLRSTGAPVPLTIRMADPGATSTGSPVAQYFTPQPMVAVPIVADHDVPLAKACGRYVDWYQSTST
jgi:hypothetical protein